MRLHRGRNPSTSKSQTSSRETSAPSPPPISFEPLPGKFPFPGLGPFSLLGDSYMNYWGKMMFKWVYFNMMLKGVELPLEQQMTMAGKMRHVLTENQGGA